MLRSVRVWWAAWPVHGAAADAVAAVAVAAVVVAGTLLPSRPPAAQPDVWGWVIALAACAALCLRRRHPLAVAVFTLVACAVYYPVTAVDGPVVLTFVVALYTAAAHRHLLGASVLAGVALFAVAYGERGRETSPLADAAPFLLAGSLLAVVAVGAYLAEVRRRGRDAQERAAEEFRRRATDERLRIAAELHDVLGHHISLINVQASAALHGLARDPGGAADALDTIKRTSREALGQLRATLGVLRAGDGAPTAPAPGLAGLDELVGRARTAGLAVTMLVEGTARPVPPEVDLAAFRIVQESLTNVARHAAATVALVRTRYEADAVHVQVDDNGRGGPVNGGGTGLRGMADRARSVGGELTAAPRLEGGFRVRARLPSPRTSP